ncbi:TRAP transporter large permease subunit [Thermodesulfobacteriota bacterium]
MAAHLFILYFGMMSMITPPVAIAAFAAATLNNADPMRTGYAAMRFGWLAFIIPFMFVFSPTLLMHGSPLLIIADTATALGGTCLVSMAIIGYFVRPLGLLHRLIFAATGLALVTPVNAFQYGMLVNLIGFIAGIIVVGYEKYWRYSVWKK